MPDELKELLSRASATVFSFETGFREFSGKNNESRHYDVRTAQRLSTISANTTLAMLTVLVAQQSTKRIQKRKI